jgi:predicted transcriptional regulator
MDVKQKKYSYKVKLSTLRILEKNDFNYLRTEKQTGISRSTFKKWEGEYGAEVFSGKSPKEVALKEVDAEIKRNDVKVIKKYYNIRYQLLDRIRELIPNETKLEPLVNTLKNISGEIAVFDELDNKGTGAISKNFLEIIENQFKAQQEGVPGQRPVDYDPEEDADYEEDAIEN